MNSSSFAEFRMNDKCRHQHLISFHKPIITNTFQLFIHALSLGVRRVLMLETRVVSARCMKDYGDQPCLNDKPWDWCSRLDELPNKSTPFISAHVGDSTVILACSGWLSWLATLEMGRILRSAAVSWERISPWPVHSPSIFIFVDAQSSLNYSSHVFEDAYLIHSCPHSCTYRLWHCTSRARCLPGDEGGEAALKDSPDLSHALRRWKLETSLQKGCSTCKDFARGTSRLWTRSWQVPSAWTHESSRTDSRTITNLERSWCCLGLGKISSFNNKLQRCDI